MRTQCAKVNGYPITYVEAGTGPALILVHGSARFSVAATLAGGRLRHLSLFT